MRKFRDGKFGGPTAWTAAVKAMLCRYAAAYALAISKKTNLANNI